MYTTDNETVSHPLSIPDDQTVPSSSPPYSGQEELSAEDLADIQDLIKVSWPYQETHIGVQPEAATAVQVEKNYTYEIDPNSLQEAVFARLERMEGFNELLDTVAKEQGEAPSHLNHDGTFDENVAPWFQNLSVVKMELEVADDEYGGVNQNCSEVIHKDLLLQNGFISCLDATSGQIKEEPYYNDDKKIITIDLTAEDLFKQMQGIGTCSSDSSDIMNSDFETSLSHSSDPNNSPRYELISHSEDSLSTDSDLDLLCSDLDNEMQTPMSASTNETSRLCMPDVIPMKLNTSLGQSDRNIDISSSVLPRFPDLLDDQQIFQTSEKKVEVNHVAKFSNRTCRDREDTDWVSGEALDDTDNDDKDDDYVPRKPPGQAKGMKRRSPNKVQNEFSPTKRSRRRSPKLWVFLLEALCDPQLNPNVISWVNKSRGTFKIQDTKKLPHLWGCRLGKTTKEGSKHNMNYEKFSRAIRYYYKNQVLNSTSGRLTYQFGPNATGWRAKTETNGN